MNQRSMRTRLLVLIALVAALVMGAPAGFGQQHPNIKKGFNVDNAYQIGELDHVNTFNGNLLVQIPIGPRFQVGGDLSYAFTATYNSKVWEFEGTAERNDNKPAMKVIPNRRANAGLGWVMTLGRILDADHPSNKTGGIIYESPDGAEHAIYCTLHEDEEPPHACDGVTTRYVNDPNQTQGYTRDGTYIRMRWESQQIAMIEFPDGTKHRFEDDPEAAHRALRIVSMEDRFGNKVKIEYPDANTCKAPGNTNTNLCWKITDTSSTGSEKRTHWMRFQEDSTQEEENYKEKIIKIELAQWNTSATAVYDFVYDTTTPRTERGCVPANFSKTRRNEPTPPRLRAIKLPTGESYQFDYYTENTRNKDKDLSCGQGGMKTMTLPTLGTIAYEYQLYKMPTMHCDVQTVLNETPGILLRTVTDTARSNTSYKWEYKTELPGPLERLCEQVLGVVFPVDISPELKNTVIMPTGENVRHYFSVWPKLADSSSGFKRHEYGLPFTCRDPVLSEDKKHTLNLSTETTDTNGSTVMSATWVSYDMDPKKKFEAHEPTTWDRNRRVLNTITIHKDEKYSQTLQDVSRFDGLGHFRLTETEGNFPGSNAKTIFTNYNPGRKMPKTDGVPTPVPPTIGKDEQWLLETFDRKTVTENDKTLATLFCFDNTGTSPTGRLKARRTIFSTSELDPGENPSQSNRDLLAVFEQVDGNITSEKYYGGDAPHTTSSTLCTPGAGEQPQYELAHTYKFGVLETSTHVGSGFLSVDNVIDPYTGLISESRDSAGIFTKFTYDSLGRIKSVTPQPGHGASFTYDYIISKSSSDTNAPQSPTVDVKANSGAVDRKFVRFDALGRVWRTFDQLPGTTEPTSETWSARQVEYDGLNRQTRVYQAAEITGPDPSTLAPSFKDSTTYAYDYFGRPKVVTPPDSKGTTDHTIKYDYHNGVSQVTETVRRIEPNGSNERNTSVKRIYDRFGRLHQVEEDAKDTHIGDLKGDKVTTTYTYDAADRLLTVKQDSQNRSFVYDGRGFLDSETHPESGLSDYNNYDARGHAGTRINGGDTLTFDYDEAERLETITEQDGKVLKKFTFGKENDGKARGKLLTATRRNDVPNAGRVDVTETYEYDGAGGQVSKRSTKVQQVRSENDRETIQSFDYRIGSYDDLLLPQTVFMPTCPGCTLPEGALSSITNSRTAGHLTNVSGFGSFTYHPSGMVENVVHQTPSKATDRYSVNNGIPRPSKITFSACGNLAPFFLPGVTVAKTNAVECGLQLTWPVASVCGGGSAVKYKVLRNNDDITHQSGSSCLPFDSPKFIDKTAVQGVQYTYRIIAKGPPVDGGNGDCQGGMTFELPPITATRGSCDTAVDLSLTPSTVTAFVGIPATYRAVLKTPSGPVHDELLIFNVNNKEIGRVKTAADGSAAVTASVDNQPKDDYAIKVIYPGGVLPTRTMTGTLKLSCGSPSYLVNPLLYNLLPGSGTYPVLVGTSIHCKWNPMPVPDPGFVTVDSKDVRQGPGKFFFSLPQNTSSADRSAKIQVALKEVSVVQSGTGCSYRFDPDIAYVPAESQNGLVSMSISTTANCEWSVEKDAGAGWLLFQPPPNNPNVHPTKGTGPREIYFGVDRQFEPSKRVATLTLRDKLENGIPAATGSVNQKAPLPAVKPGQIREDLRDGSVANGSNVTLRVWVEEGTQLEYSWFINDVPIYPSCRFCDSMTLHPGDNGYPAPNQSSTFAVTVFNNRGEVHSKKVSWFNNGTVPMQNCPPGGRVPYIYEGPFRPADTPLDSFSPRSGHNVSLWVTGSSAQQNSGTPTFEWYRGISGDESSRIPPDPDLNPDTIQVNPFSTSFYWVKVTDNCGPNLSRSAMVIVTQGPQPRRRACCSFDVTGDGHSDLAWHNTATGQNEVWAMSNTTHANTYALPANNDPKAQLQSGGDINADGMVDLLWRNPETGANHIWLMNRTNLSDIQSIDSRAGSQWTIGAISDFDLDDHDDIVWHNSATGANEIWFNEGTGHIGTWALPNSGGSNGLYGKGDFNGDEKPDLFFHDRATGTNQIWIMDEGSRKNITSNSLGARMMNVSTLSVPSATPNLVPALVADMNADGKADIVWRNSVNGENSVWLMNGSQVGSTVALETRSDPNWQIGGGGNGTNPGSGGDVTPPGTTATSLNVVVDPVSAGTLTVATATLTAGTNPVAQRQIVFLLSGTEVTRLLTDAEGNATAVIDTAGRTAGTYTNAITVRFEGDAVYASSTKSADLVITSETPTVSWNEPDPIVYGTPLSATQLNATASVPGAFVYSPPAGTIVGAGYQTLTVTFTPSDASLATITQSTVLFVNKAPSSVSWATPAPIAYGMPLSDLQLNATSSLAGTFTYAPGPGSILGIGTHSLNVSFEPDDPNFNVSTASTIIQVGKGTQSIFWDDPAPINVFQPLGAAQLNAKVLAAGTAPAGAVTYTPAAGTFLTTGVHELRVDVAATAEYEAASASVDIVVLRVQSIVQWATPAPIVYGTPLNATQLNATANVPGTFTYSHNVGTILDAGTVQLFVSFTSSDERYEESSAGVTLQITRAQQTISWNRPAPIVYGTPLSEMQLNAQVQVAGPESGGLLTYSPEPGTILPAGLGQTLTFVAEPTVNYHAATASVTIDVLKATQSIAWTAPAPIVYGTPLGAEQLNAGVTVVGPAPAGALSYNPPAGTVMQAGNGQLLTVTAVETANYQPATLSVPIDVLKQKPVLAWSTPAPIVYRTALTATQLNATSNVAGSFAYAPPAGTVLEAGLQLLSAHFTPADTRNYEEGDITVTLEVQQATPIITWPKPAGIVYGTALSATQLNATADVPGAFTYDPAAGTILNAGPGQTLAVLFEPADTRNFTNANATVTLDVAKAKQTLTWTLPSIVYGTALSATQLNAEVSVVGPAPAGALVYTPPAGTVLDAGQHTLTVVAQETANYESATLTATIVVNRAPLSLTVDAKSKLYGSPVPALTGTLVGVVNNDPITPAYATTATLQSVVGQYPITGSLVDPSNHLPNYEVTITNATLTVLPAPLTIAAEPKSKQYSDPIPAFTATYIGLVLGETPAVLSGTLVMETAATMVSAPGTYPITIGGLTSPNYAITSVGSTLTVLPEDARVIITSPLFLSVAPSGPTPVTLSATVRDISATPDAADDTYPGDIRKATLTFVDRATGNTLCTAVIGLAGASEQTGIATCTFTRDFGTVLPATLTIGAKIGAYYTRDAAADNVILTVSKPTPDQINGAGKVVIASAAGSHVPDAGSETQFQIQFQYDENGVVKGNFSFTFTRTEGGVPHRYELTPASVSSLAINRNTPAATAMIIATGTLIDTTTRQTIATSVPLLITATDTGTQTADQLGLTMLKSDGGIWLATGWNGVQTVQLPISNGQIQVEEKK